MRRTAACVAMCSMVCALGCGGSDFSFGFGGDVTGTGSGTQSGVGQGGTSQGSAGQGGTSQGGAGQGGTSQGGAGQGGGGVEQNCINGFDDDGDGLTDCADPDCSSFSCVPAPPAGWSGVAWLDPAASPAPCPAELANQTDLFDAADLNAPPASCSCACGAAIGVACGAHIRCAPSAGECAAMGNLNGQSDICGSNIPNVGFPAYCRANPPGPVGGGCAPSTAGAAPQWSWMPATRACATDLGGACADAGSVCVPKLAGGIGPCITQAGDLACPAPYGNKVLYYDGKAVMDDRACDGGACACAAPAGSTCDCGIMGCQVELYGNAACGMKTNSLPTNDVCSQVLTKPAAAKLVGATPVAGACAPGGAAKPTGGAKASAPVTVCCAP